MLPIIKWDSLLLIKIIIFQAANIGPILFSILRKFKDNLASLRYTSYLILFIGFLAAILLSLFWEKEIKVGKKMTSLPLLFLAFVFALTDCTSSVVFLPFMAKFPQSYMVPFYIGEGISGVVPSMLALAQGTGGKSCQNITINESESGPRFTVNVYFGLTSILMAISAGAFYLLNNKQVNLRERLEFKELDDANILPEEGCILNQNESELPLNEEVKKRSEIRVYDVFFGAQREQHAQLRWSLLQLYTIIVIVSAFGNGVIPSVSSYACMPYGPSSYHIATELSLIANPICCFLAFFLACKSPLVLDVLCAIAVAIAAVIIYTATLSPEPWLVGTSAGSVLMIMLFILWSGCISYIKVNVASILQQYGEDALLICGVVTQLGACCGAVIIFLVTTKTNTFISC